VLFRNSSPLFLSLESSTALDANGLSRYFKITHSFHPWSGRRLSLYVSAYVGENRVYFQQEQSEHLVSVPATWTDVVPEDPFVQAASGQSLFRVRIFLNWSRW